MILLAEGRVWLLVVGVGGLASASLGLFRLTSMLFGFPLSTGLPSVCGLVLLSSVLNLGKEGVGEELNGVLSLLIWGLNCSVFILEGEVWLLDVRGEGGE